MARESLTRSSRWSAARSPSATAAPSSVADESRRESEPGPRQHDLASHACDESGTAVRVVQVVHDAPDLADRAVDVIKGFVHDLDQLCAVDPAGRPTPDRLQLHAGGEQLLDRDVVQVPRYPLALLEECDRVLGGPCLR